MKKILVLLFLGFVALHAQDKEPSAWKFYFNNSSYPSEFDPNSYNQTTVLTGFQWAGHVNMDNALLNNVRTTSGYPTLQPGESRTYQLQYVGQPRWQDNSGWNEGSWRAPFIQYEPALPLDNSNKGQILRSPGDKSDPIFGFLTRRGEPLSQNQNDPDYSRFVLLANKYPYSGNINDKVVLSDIWPNPHFKSTHLGKLGGQSDAYVGKVWYLTIKLKRKNLAQTVQGNPDILRITLPYKLGTNSLPTDNVKFNKIPIRDLAWNDPAAKEELIHYDYVSDKTNNVKHQDDRGIARKLESYSSRELIIKADMIPDIADKDVTISAQFITCIDLPLSSTYNPAFTQDLRNSDLITNLNIVVEYLGQLDIAIDYIRLESINAHLLLRGELDYLQPRDQTRDGRGFIDLSGLPSHGSPTIDGNVYDDSDPESASNIYEQINDIYNIVQTTLDALNTKITNNDGRLFRLFYQCEEVNDFYWWGPLRYCNLLSNNMYITRDELQYPDAYYYYTRCPNRWISCDLDAHECQTPAPYIKNGIQDWRSMNLKFGYDGNGNIGHFRDGILNSKYETAIPSGKSLADIKTDGIFYFGDFFSSDHQEILQPIWERDLYSWYFKDETKSSQLIFSDKPWWINYLFYNVGRSTNPVSIVHIYRRPKTGEELRLAINSALLKGCKGLTYDGDWNMRFPDTQNTGQMGIGNSDLYCDPAKTDYYTYWDVVGSDFIDLNNTWDVLTDCFNGSMSDPTLTTVANYCQVPNDRLYIGTKSIRAELYKLNSLIRAADQELMSLRLDAYLCKGYRTWYKQNDDANLNLPANILNKFVDVYLGPSPNYTNQNFKSRKIGWQHRIVDDEGEYVWEPLYEPWEDSCFVDVTLFQNSQGNVYTDDKWYLGVQNKRTDPLIHVSDSYDPVTGEKLHNMAYYSSAELEHNARSGGKDYFTGNVQTPEWWQQLIFKRQGCREMTIPVPPSAFAPGANTDGWNNYLKITDLGSGTPLDNLWFRKEPFFTKEDQIMCINGWKNIILKFQPGEGRILKFERKPICSMIGDINIVKDINTVLCRASIHMPILNNGQDMPCLSRVELYQNVYSNGSWNYQLLNLGYTFRYGDLVFQYVYSNSDPDHYNASVIDVMAKFYVLDENGNEHQLSCVKTAKLYCNDCPSDGGLGNPVLGPGSLLPCGMNFMVPVSHPENTGCLSRVDFETQTLSNGIWNWQTIYSGSPATHYSSGYYQFNNLCAVYDPFQNKYRFHGRMKFYSNDGSGDYAILPTFEIDTLLTPPVCCTQAPIQYTVSNCMYNMKYFSLPGCEQVFGIAKSANGGAFTTVMFNPINPLSALPAGFMFDSIQIPVGTPMTVIYRTLDQDGNPICDLAPMFLSCAGGIINPETGMEKDAGSNQKLLCYAVPNPATDETTIFYQVPGDGSSDVKIDLFGVMGNYVKTILNGNSKAGINYVKLSSKDMVNGAYFIKVTIGMNTASFPIIIMK